MKGWIKLYRQLQDCWIWQENETFDKRSAWIDLLLSANHKDKKILFNGQLIIVKRGQYLTSIRRLSERWKWSYDKCSRFLKLLEDDGMLRKESDRSRTLITIKNYSNFQDDSSTDLEQISEQSAQPQVNTSDTDRTSISGQALEQISEQSVQSQVNTTSTDRTPIIEQTSDKQECKEYKNVKNDEECKNERMEEDDNTPLTHLEGGIDETQKQTRKKKEAKVYYPNDEKLNQAFIDFMEMRKKIRKPMTDRAIELAMKKLQDMATVPPSNAMDNDLAIKILEQSTMNCWQGLFELKQDNTKKNNSIVDEWRNS